MVFRATLVSKDTAIPTIPLPKDIASVVGRDKRFGINDRRVSRKHIEIIPSSTAKSVILHQLSTNPSVIIRKNEQPATLEKDDFYQLQEGDVLSLLNGKYVFTLTIEDDESKEMEDGYSEELTQVDLEAIEEAEKRKKRKSPDEEDMGETNKRAKLDRNILPANSSVLINPNELIFKRTIGNGSCGEVTECTWRGTSVAVKRIFRTLLHGDAIREFYQESEIMRRLRHPNIVLFMGTCVQSRDLCIVTEFMEKGSLKDVLYNPSEVLDWNLRLRMAADAARGMNYLHTYSPPVIHRDLKSHNLLVDQNYVVKVTDFGLAKFNPTEDKNKTFCGTLPWTAPEVFSGKGYSGKADIYSYGIVLWEIAARTEPYAGVDKPKLIIGVTTEKMRPPIPVDCLPGFAELIKECWAEDPEARPSFVELLKRIESFISQTSSNSDSNSNSTNSLVHSGKLEIGTSSTPNPTPMTLTAHFQEAVKEKTLNFQWEIDPKDLEFLGDLGEGASATVYRGKYKGNTVAIKVLKDSLDGKHRDDFYKELEVIGSVKSPHVVDFYGACTAPQFAIVTEFLANGSLFQVMTRPEALEWELCIKLALESAQAINALHKWNPPIIHRDVKPQNLLVDFDWSVKIADFGLARFFNTNNQSLAKLKGSYAYAAPEPYKGLPVTTKSDVFSFGIVLWELVNTCVSKKHQKPYSEHPNLKFDFQIIIQTAKQGLRPTIHAQTPVPFKELIQKCWDPEPANRPTMETVVSDLVSISELFQKEKARNV